MTTKAAENASAAVLSLEIVELELALRHQDLIENGFEGAVRQALSQVGGTLLFQMRMDGVDGCDWIAAVALNGEDDRKFAIIAKPTDGGPLKVEDAETSDIPIARLANAYANVMGKLGESA